MKSEEKTDRKKTGYDHLEIMRGKKVPGTLKKNPGLYSGPFKMGLGILGFIAFGGSFAGCLAGALISKIAIVPSGIFMLLALASVFLFGKGFTEKKRARRIKEYAEYWKGKSYIMIDDLAKACDSRSKKVRKDLRFLMDRKLLPGAALDISETCLMLTEESRKQYEEAMDAKRNREKEAERKKQMEDKMNHASPEEKEIFRVKKDGEMFIEQISALRRQISSYDVSEELKKLEVTTARIVVCASEHPESIKKTDRLFQYYFPSVIKMGQIYADMESQPIQGDNIVKTRKEIEESLDTMNQAMEKMFDEMYQNVVLDISSDISVLKVMLKQDGLTEDGMKADKENALF